MNSIHNLAKINKLMKSYATYRNSQNRLKERAFYPQLGGLLMLEC